MKNLSLYKFTSLVLFIISLAVLPLRSACAVYELDHSGIYIHPVEHASMVIVTDKYIIYVDPTGNKERYSRIGEPDLIVITHIHGDHLDETLINDVKKDSTRVIGPKDVINKLGYGQILDNGMETSYSDIGIKAVPAYNTSPERLDFHPKGRDNGYILRINGKNIYISGDTEDVPEMRTLNNIDLAFICMNLPYTMTVEQAASAVLEFKPAVVIPYHYRGKNMISDISKFKDMISADGKVKVVFLKWYKDISPDGHK